ncbi:MAG: S4 domain-containing protein [Acidobacteriota bacterium]
MTKQDKTERAGLDAVRLDVWLDIACLFRTRSEAQSACKGGKVTVNAQSARANRMIRAGDEIVIGRPFGRSQKVTVKVIADRHVAKIEARQFYEDLTPKPTAEEMEMRRIERVYRAAMSPPRAPDKRERRLLRQIKGKG